MSDINIDFTVSSINANLQIDPAPTANFTVANNIVANLFIEGTVGVGSGGTVTQVATAGTGLGFSLTGGPINTSGTITLNIPTDTALRTSLNIGNIANVNLNGNGSQVLVGNGDWVAQTAGGTVTNVSTSGSGLGFSLSGGPITTTGTITLATPSDTALRTSLNIGNVANINLNGNGSQVLAGNGSWVVQTGGGGSGTVTSVNTAGSGLGFSLSGGPITSTGTVTLATPTDTALRTSLNIGNIANINLNGNSNQYLNGSGNWVSQSTDIISNLRYGTEGLTLHTTATGTYNLDVLTNSIAYSTVNATANITLNIRGNSTTSLNSMLANSNSVTVTYMMTTGNTGYYIPTVQIDGSAQTVRYVSNITPALNTNCITNYTYTIIKTSTTPTYVVLGSQTRYG